MSTTAIHPRRLLEDRRAGFTLTIPTRPRPDLPEVCRDALLRHRVPLRRLSILWDPVRPGWQELVIETQSCPPEAAEAVARELSDPSPLM
jgi:hypothetical protein